MVIFIIVSIYCCRKRKCGGSKEDRQECESLVHGGNKENSATEVESQKNVNNAEEND